MEKHLKSITHQKLKQGYDRLLREITRRTSVQKGLALVFNVNTKKIELYSIVQVNSEYVLIDTPIWTDTSDHDFKYPESKSDDRRILFKIMTDFLTNNIPENITLIEKYLDK